MSDTSTYIIISLGGSLIVPDGIDTNFLASFRDAILEYTNKGYKFVLITGGGKVCRRYQDSLNALREVDNDTLDWLGIYTTRLNAEFVRLIFGKDAHAQIIIDPHVVPNFSESIIIGAGWKPGWSTDYDAIVIAESLGAKHVINLSNIDYAYTKDPRNNKDATPIISSTWKDFRAFLPKEWDPGLSAPFDPIAAEKAESLGVEVAIMNGVNINNFKNYLDKKDFIGTTIS